MPDIFIDNKRLGALESSFKAEFGEAPKRLFSSPGRAEIVGNHTDHNRGKVLVSAISCDILSFVSPRTDGIIDIRAEAFSPVRFSVTDLAGREREKGKSVSLARGVCRYFVSHGYPVGGFSAVTHSTVFRGAGVSSSAAFEVLVAEILNTLYCGGRISPLECARAAQYAENVYFGKPCGLLDQCGVAFGGLNKIDFFDLSAPAVEPVPAPAGYEIVLTNTGGSHAALTSHYADIRREMGEVACALGKSVLRETSEEELLSELPRLRKKVSDRALLRAFHYFEENERVDRAAASLKEGDVAGFLAAVRQSGESSLAFLQNCYVPGDTAQPLALALKLSEKLIKEGAFRMMGGGFTGAVIAFVRDGEEYGRAMARIFGRENVFYTTIREQGSCEV